MRAVNARLDLSRVSVFHAVRTRRGVHRARGSLCALVRATGLILEISLASGTDQLAGGASLVFFNCSSFTLQTRYSSLITWTHPWAFSA